MHKVQHMTGRKTGCNRSRPVFFWFFDFSTNVATGNRKNSEFVQPQPVVQSFSVGFSPISVFFPVQQTVNTNHDPLQSESQTQPLSFDTDIFWTYFLALLTLPIIDALPSEFGLLFNDEFDERVARFAAESGGVVYIVKVKDEVEGLSFYLYLHIGAHWETTQMTEEHWHTRTTSPHI